VALSEPGLARALLLGGRLTAILLAFLTALAVVSPARLVDAMTERGVPFARMYLLVSTLTLVPRLRVRAAAILEAQQCRGLRLGGGPVARVAALGPLVLPLVLGALAEVDEQVLALDSRGAMLGGRRTALETPPDTAAERTLRRAMLAVAAAALAFKLAGRVL
jgi:energy-coupling factor transport system permease protein